MGATTAAKAAWDNGDMPMYLDLLKSWERGLRNLTIKNLRSRPRRRRKT